MRQLNLMPIPLPSDTPPVPPYTVPLDATIRRQLVEKLARLIEKMVAADGEEVRCDDER